jgi:hypothetical protein
MQLSIISEDERIAIEKIIARHGPLRRPSARFCCGALALVKSTVRTTAREIATPSAAAPDGDFPSRWLIPLPSEKGERAPMSNRDPWVGDVYRPKEQKAALLAFADAIGAKRRLGADEAGNPRLEGKTGRVYVQPSTCDPGRSPQFQLYIFGSDQRWRYAKEALSAFAKVTNDGRDEGLLVIGRLPTESEGEIIRDKLGLKKRFVFTEEILAQKRATIERVRTALSGAGGEKSPKASDLTRSQRER